MMKWYAKISSVIFLIVLSQYSLYGMFESFKKSKRSYSLEKELNSLFEEKNYEKLQGLVDRYLHNVRDDLYANSNRWFFSKDKIDIAEQVDRHRFILSWLTSKYKKRLCLWAYYNVFRDAMRSFSYSVKGLESYDKYSLKSIFVWLVFFNFLHIGLISYYKSDKALVNQWFSKTSPADFFKDCCYYRVKKYLPKKEMPEFRDCFSKACSLISSDLLDNLHDCCQLLFVYNNAYMSNWLCQKNPQGKIVKSVDSHSAKNKVFVAFRKLKQSFAFYSTWSDFWNFKD